MKNTHTTRQIRRRLAVFVTVLGLAAFTAGPIGAETTTIDVNGGTLSSTTNSITFSAVTLDGSDTTTTGNATWTVADGTTGMAADGTSRWSRQTSQASRLTA